MKHAIRAVLSFALVLGCSAPEDESLITRECDSAVRCWVLGPDWGSWGLSYESAHLDSLEASETVVQISPAPAGDTCWRAGDHLPLCEVEIDGALVHGFPVAMASDLYNIDLTHGVCNDTYPWDYVGFTRGTCYGVIDGVAVQLDLSRPVPAEFAP